MSPLLLLAALAWAVATRGGTGLRDLLVVLLRLGWVGGGGRPCVVGLVVGGEG